MRIRWPGRTTRPGQIELVICQATLIAQWQVSTLAVTVTVAQVAQCTPGHWPGGGLLGALAGAIQLAQTAGIWEVERYCITYMFCYIQPLLHNIKRGVYKVL